MASANNSPSAATEPPDPPPARGLYLRIGSHSGAHISKLDPQTRQPTWTRDAGSIRGPLVVYGDVLYALASTGTYPDETNGIAAFSTQDGTVLWHTYFSQDWFHIPNGRPYNVGSFDLGVLSEPLVTHGMVYTLARNGTLYALDAATGRQCWSYRAAATALLEDLVTLPDGTVAHNYGLTEAPAVTFADGVVYGAIHNALFAVEAQTGKPLWSSNIDQTLAFNAPVSVDGRLYLSSYEERHHTYLQSHQGYVSAYNPNDGALIWRHTVGNWVLTPPMVVHEVVYFGSYDNYLYALKAGDGSQLWRYDTGGQIFNQPVIADGVIYIAGRGKGVGGNSSTVPSVLLAISTAGKLVWSKEIANLVCVQEVQNGQIYASVSPGQLTIFSTQDGSQMWSKANIEGRDKYGNLMGHAPLMTLVE